MHIVMWNVASAAAGAHPLGTNQESRFRSYSTKKILPNMCHVGFGNRLVQVAFQLHELLGRGKSCLIGSDLFHLL